MNLTIDESQPMLPAATEGAPTMQSYNGDLVAMAIDRNLDTEKLQALIDMRNKQEERENKRAFDEAFARMQAEFETVHRSKQGHGYKYAPLEVLQKTYGPVIARHGFSYRWREETIEGGGKRTIMRISGHGHAEENYFDAPALTGNKAMNPVQAAGAMSTYGRRYTFLSGFGVIVEDEDPDANVMTPQQTEKLHAAIDDIRTADTLDALKSAFASAYQSHSDSMARKMITEAKDTRKKELANG